MADNTISFRIGSIFSGEGFQKARAAVLETNKVVKQSTQAVSLLASNIGMLDAKYSKATSAITGLITALSSGNPIIAAVQVGMVGFAAIAGKLQEKMDALKKAADETAKYYEKLHESLVKSFNEKQAAQMQKYLDVIESIGAEFDEITRSANEFTAAVNKLDATRDAGGVLQMQLDKLFAVAETKGANSGLVAAQKDYEIVLRENTIREKRAGEAIDAANKARLDAQGKANNCAYQIVELDRVYAENLEKLNSAGTVDVKVREQIINDNKTIAAKIKELEKERSKAEAAMTTAEYALKQAEEEQKNAVLQGTINRVKAQQAVTDAQDAVAKEYEKEKEELRKKREKERADLTNQLRDAEGKQKQAEAALKNAQGGPAVPSLADALAAWNANLNANLINERIKAFFAAGGFDQIANRLNLQSKEDQEAAAAAAVAEGIKDGSIRTSAQANKAARDAARAQRDYASSKQARQEAQDARRLEQLERDAKRAAETGRKLDPRKQAELDQLRALQRGKNAQKNALDAAKQAEERARQNLQQAAQDVAAIKKKLEKLGLK